MKITKQQLASIIKEEYAEYLQELGPETGHPEGSDPLAVLEKVSADLIEVAGVMETAPSHTTASEFAGFVRSIGEEVKDILNEHDAEAGRNPGGSIGERKN